MNENILLTCTVIIAILFNTPSFFDLFNKNNKEDILKRIIMLFGGFFASLIFTTLLLMPISFASTIENNMVLSIYPFIALTYLVVKFIAFMINYIKVLKSNYTDIYVRDVFVDYSPAVLSLLLNHKTEDKKDFHATVLNIHAKKVIEFKQVDNKLEIVDLQNQKAINNLTEDEKYIYNVLIEKEKFDKHLWHKLIKQELNKRNLVKSGNKNILWQIVKMYLILFGIIFLLLILFVLSVLLVPGEFFKNIATNYFNYNIVLSITWILVLIPLQLGTLKIVMLINKHKYLKDKMDYYTKKGALEMLKWKKFGAFIKDYSMIATANAESVVLWEKYISYAMALNINKTYNSNELKKINEYIQTINWLI